MSITFECEHCRKTIKAPDSAAGSRGKCPHCGQSCYIPAPVSEEDLVPLAPIDEEDERRQQEEVRRLMEQEREILTETGGQVPVPLEHREKLSSEDLHHLVVNFCLDMHSSKLDRADRHAAELHKHGPLGLAAVEDFLSGKLIEPALDPVPTRTLRGFLTELKRRLTQR